MMLDVELLLDIPYVPGPVAVQANRDSEPAFSAAPIRTRIFQPVLRSSLYRAL